MNILALDDEDLALEGLLDSITEVAPTANLHGFNYADDALLYAKDNKIDVAFLDIEMSGLSGMDLAEELRALNPNINIIFATGFDDYMKDAFDLRASGYLKKPITPKKILNELSNLRFPVEEAETNKLKVQAFGNFEVYYKDIPLSFKYAKTRELFAYLVDRAGALCTNAEVITTLFDDDENHDAYLRSLRKDLLDTLDEVGCKEVITVQRGKLAVIPSMIECDYYHWIAGDSSGYSYRGEYMTQYSWGEYTNGRIEAKEYDNL